MTTVLLVDDNRDMRELLRVHINLMGFVAITAKDGKDAVEVATTDKPDLIVMDIMMPEMDGWEATRILRADPETREIPILVMTALSQRINLQKCLEAGCNEYIVKPFTWNELQTRIKALVPFED
jgi:CheY-like chemotaxis protein